MVYSRRVRMEFSPDGRRVALSLGWLWKAVDPARATDSLGDTENREVHVWDTDKGDELCHILPSRGGSRFDGLAFGPKGKQLAIVVAPSPGKEAGSVRVWNVDDGKEVFTLPVAGMPREVAFSPDGGRIAAALSREKEAVPDDANQVQVWDAATRKDPLAIKHNGRLPNGIAFNPDGTRLAVVWKGPKDETLSLHDAGTGKGASALEGVVQADAGSRPQPVFRPDGRRLTLPASGSLVRVWDVDTGHLRYTARGHAGTPAVAFGADGTRLLTAGRDGTVKEWAEPAPRPAPEGLEASDALADRLKHLFGYLVPQPDWREMSRTFSPLASAYTPNGLRLARASLVGEGDKAALEVRIWDEKGGPFRVPIHADIRPNKLGRLLFNQDGTRLIAQYVIPALNPWEWRSGLKAWDTASGKEVFAADTDNPFAGLLTVSPDGSRVACNRSGGGVRVLDAASGRQLLDAKEGIVNCTAFSADGSRIAWGTMDSVRLWDVDAAKEVLTIHNTGGPVGLLAFSPDGMGLAGAVGPIYVHGEVKVWNAADGRELLSLKGQTSVHDLAFSPDGRRLAAYRRQHDNDGDHPGVTLWDAGNGLPLLQLGVTEGHADTHRRLQFDPVGGRLFLVNLYPQNRGDAYEVWDATPTADESARAAILTSGPWEKKE